MAYPYVEKKSSWKTTTLAILALVIAVSSAAYAVLDGDPTTNPDFGALGAAATAASVGLFARDNGVTSEQAGAK